MESITVMGIVPQKTTEDNELTTCNIKLSDIELEDIIDYLLLIADGDDIYIYRESLWDICQTAYGEDFIKESDLPEYTPFKSENLYEQQKMDVLAELFKNKTLYELEALLR